MVTNIYPPIVTDINNAGFPAANKVILSIPPGSINLRDPLYKIISTGGKFRVVAPLPDSFGVDVQSTMSQPFASFVPQGTITTIAAARGLTPSAGFAIFKYFTATDTPDISMDLVFTAQSDAITEVLFPVCRLYIMACAHRAHLPAELVTFMANFLSFVAKVGAGGINVASAGLAKIFPGVTPTNFKPPTADTIAAAINNVLYWLGGPPHIHVNIGNIYTLGLSNQVTMSALSPRFSNNVDYNGVPMQCTCSVTLTLKQPFINLDVPKSFANGYIGNTSASSLSPPRR